MLKHIYRSFTWLYLLIDSTVYSYINTFVYTHTHTHTHTRSLSSISRDGFVYIAEGHNIFAMMMVKLLKTRSLISISLISRTTCVLHKIKTSTRMITLKRARWGNRVCCSLCVDFIDWLRASLAFNLLTMTPRISLFMFQSNPRHKKQREYKSIGNK